MTVVAYKNGVLAADTLVSDDTLVYGHTIKIKRVRHGWLVGGCGNIATLQQFLQKWSAGVAIPAFDTDDDSFSGVALNPRGYFLTYEKEGVIKLDLDIFAIGSGGQVALGAMHAGATAEEAVKVAIKLIGNCGGNVTTLKLGG